MSHPVLERYLPPIPYLAEDPELKVNIDGSVSAAEHDESVAIHLNKFRPLWAIGHMKALVRDRGVEPDSDAMLDYPVSFTLTLWRGGLDDWGMERHLRVMTTIRQAQEKTAGACALETAIATLVKLHVERPIKQRGKIKRPRDLVGTLETLKGHIQRECLTQAGGPTRAQLNAQLAQIQHGIGLMGSAVVEGGNE